MYVTSTTFTFSDIIKNDLSSVITVTESNGSIEDDNTLLCTEIDLQLACIDDDKSNSNSSCTNVAINLFDNNSDGNSDL